MTDRSDNMYLWWETMRRHCVSFCCAVYNVFLVVMMFVSFVFSALAYMGAQVYGLTVERLRRRLGQTGPANEEGVRLQAREDRSIDFKHRRPAA